MGVLNPFQFVLISVAGWMNQQRQQAIDYLREEDRVLREQLGGRRLRFTDDQRRRLAARAKGLGSRSPGRPRTDSEIESLVVRMAGENRDGGYTRILGALSNLGCQLARGTVVNILKRHGIDPAPERSRKTTWKEFLTQHWDLIVAANFFTIEVWTAKGPRRADCG